MAVSYYLEGVFAYCAVRFSVAMWMSMYHSGPVWVSAITAMLHITVGTMGILAALCAVFVSRVELCLFSPFVLFHFVVLFSAVCVPFLFRVAIQFLVLRDSSCDAKHRPAARSAASVRSTARKVA